MCTFLFFWTGEPCNEVLRTKRSDFRDKILKEGVTNISMYIIILKNHIFGNKNFISRNLIVLISFQWPNTETEKPRCAAGLESKLIQSLTPAGTELTGLRARSAFLHSWIAVNLPTSCGRKSQTSSWYWPECVSMRALGVLLQQSRGWRGDGISKPLPGTCQGCSRQNLTTLPKF